MEKIDHLKDIDCEKYNLVAIKKYLKEIEYFLNDSLSDLYVQMQNEWIDVECLSSIKMNPVINLSKFKNVKV